MTGILVITHAKLGRELVNAAEFILGKIENLETIAVEGTPDPEHLKRGVAASLERLNQGQGVLVLTDMFGGTPNNISLAFLKPGQVEVVTGVNLPMLIKASAARKKTDISALGKVVGQAGSGAISVASEILAS